MTLTAIHRLTEERILIPSEGDFRQQYDEWDQLICPISGNPVFPRKGHLRGNSKVRQHFVNKAAADEETWPDDVVFDPEYGQIRKGKKRIGGESWEHLEGKHIVFDTLKEQYGAEVRIEFEYSINIREGKKRIADVAVLLPCGFIEAHEVQLADVTESDMRDKVDDYEEAGVDCKWWLGKSTADKYDLRNYLRRLQGGFQLLSFTAKQSEHDSGDAFF